VILSWVYWLKGMRPGEEKTGDTPSTTGEQQPLQAEETQASL